MKFLTRSNVISFAILMALIPISAIFIQNNCDLHSQSWCNSNWSLIGRVGGLAIVPVVLLLPFSLITLPLKLSVFESWKKFAVWSVPVVLIVVFALSSMETNGSIGGMVEQRMLATAIIGLYVAYAIVSVAIIGTSWWKSRK